MFNYVEEHACSGTKFRLYYQVGEEKRKFDLHIAVKMHELYEVYFGVLLTALSR